MKSMLLMTVAAVAATPLMEVRPAKADAPVEQASDTKRAFQIPAQSLTSALNEFGRQSGRDILFSTQVAGAKRTAGVNGSFTPEEALRALLVGTGLKFRATNEQTFLVEQQNADSTAQPPTANTQQQESTRSDSEEVRPVEKVTVTGTSIRGLKNPTAPVKSYGRKDIDKAGYPNTQQFIRSLPQNSAGGQAGASEDGVLGPGGSAAFNVQGASGVNLRGLGPNSTLTLLNGHRMSPSVFGSIIDISAIPVSAIERIDVLTDGASAIYGADAVAGVVNFILRKDYDGAESSLLYGSVTDGGLDERIAGQAFGATWNGGGAFAALQYHDRGALRADERAFTSGVSTPTNIINPFVKYSAILSWNQQLLSNLDTFGDALFSRDNTRQVFSQGPSFNYDYVVDTDAQNLHGGVGYEPFADWRLEASATYSRQHFTATYAVSPDPILFPAGEENFWTTNITTSFDFKADGTLFEAAAGEIRGAFGASYRIEDFSAFTVPFSLYSAENRSVAAQFVEVFAPVIAETNALPLVRQLALSAAVRHDQYSDFGDTTNPKFGVLWSPAAGLDLRASWGTSFRAPNVTESILEQSQRNLFTLEFTDPSGVGVVPILFVTGSDQLRPETSENWTIGLDYVPEFLTSAKLTLNYYKIAFSDRIINPPFDSNALTQPDVYGSLISPIASDAAAASYIADFIASGGAYFDFVGTGPTGVRFIWNGQQQNAARVEQSGFDVLANYKFDVDAGTIDIGLNASVIEEIVTTFSPSSTPVDLVNKYGNPLRLRFRTDLTWSYDALQINGALNFNNSYENTTVTPSRGIDSYTTLDLSARWAVAVGEGWLSGTTFGLNISNVFDEAPPFVQGTALSRANYDVGNADPIGRYISVTITRTW